MASACSCSQFDSGQSQRSSSRFTLQFRRPVHRDYETFIAKRDVESASTIVCGEEAISPERGSVGVAMGRRQLPMRSVIGLSSVGSCHATVRRR
jgi:hypothetical protein